jgi:hypothetical protein
MKNHSIINVAAILILGSATTFSLLTSCEGPQGIAGVDANESCTQCHNSESLLIAKVRQSANSTHQTGITSFENSTSCAPCHTSQGFLETLVTDTTVTAAAVENPVPANCRTCHKIHENYDSTDFAVRTVEPITLRITAGLAKLDLGESNLCAKCHQPRSIATYPVLGGSDVSITSSRALGHYGAQAVILAGVAAYKIPGAEAYPTAANPHAAAGCVTCHMATALGSLAGGHTLKMSDPDEGDNLAGCIACHPSATDFDLGGTQTEVEGLLGDLNAALTTAGILTASGSTNASTSKPLVLTADKAGALLNYYLIKNDRSMGVHNPAYVRALLKNSIALFAV